MRNLRLLKRLFLSATMLLCFGLSISYSSVIPSGGLDGRQWYIGTSQRVVWSISENLDSTLVDIYLFNLANSSFTLIATNVDGSQGWYNVFVPTSITPNNYYKVKVVDMNNCENYAISTNFFSILPLPPILESKEINRETALTLFPNPATDKINISSSKNYSGIKVYDIHSRIVYEKYALNECVTEIPTLGLSNGLYFVEIYYDGIEPQFTKIVVNK